MATRTEPERDGWIERLHIAGFECLRIQLQSLREQLKARTGRDPIEFGGLAVDGIGTEESTSGTFQVHLGQPVVGVISSSFSARELLRMDNNNHNNKFKIGTCSEALMVQDMR